MRFSRQSTMKRAFEFARVREKGKVSAGQLLLLSILEDPALKSSRVGIICTKKIGNAVMRNLLRRRVRALFQKHGALFFDQKPRYIVVVLRWKAADAVFEALEKDWLKQAKRLDLIS